MSNPQGTCKAWARDASGRRPMTFMTQRACKSIQAYIAKQEATALLLTQTGVVERNFLAQMQALAADVRGKKELLAKLIQQ